MSLRRLILYTFVSDCVYKFMSLIYFDVFSKHIYPFEDKIEWKKYLIGIYLAILGIKCLY